MPPRLDLSHITGAIDSLADIDRYSYSPTMDAFGVPKAPDAPKAPPQRDPFDPSGWYQTYENAQIPASALAPVGNTKFLMEPHAAAAMETMIQAASADGVGLSIGNTYRDFATQADAFENDPTPATPTLAPGTSNHGWGLAADLVITPENHAWLVKNAARFGFTNPFGMGYDAVENWHWEFAQDGSAPTDPAMLQQVGMTQRHKIPATDPKAPVMSALAGLSAPSSMANVVTSLLAREQVQRTRGRPPVFKGTTASIKEQLYYGFLKADRADLAKMVNTRDFQTWIGAESGWNPASVSQYYEGHGRNFGLFQFWDGHEWTKDYYSGGQWTATPYEQAIMVAKYFSALTPDDIRNYAASIRAGTYSGWPT